MHSDNSLQKYKQNTKLCERFIINNAHDIYEPEWAWAISEIKTNPPLSEVSRVYGYGTTDDWLSAQMIVTFGRCGFSYQTSAEDAITFCAETIRQDFASLRIREIKKFLRKFQKADYGDYGRVFNSQKFFKALNTFVTERNKERERAKNELLRQQKQDKPPVDGQQALESYIKNASDDSFIKRIMKKL